MNLYLGAIAETVKKHDGTLGKFLWRLRHGVLERTDASAKTRA